MPRHDALYIPDPPTKIVPCVVCQTGLEVGTKVRSPQRCVACGCKALAANIREIHQKSGPYYERWLSGIIRGVSSQPGARESGILNSPSSSSNGLTGIWPGMIIAR
jgi:hypothetical protein